MPLDLDVGGFGEKAAAMGSTALQWFLIAAGGIAVLGILGAIAAWAMKRKKWNLIVEIKMPRNNGQVILRERAKGYYDATAGIVDIKRKKLKKVGMKPFDVKKYLQGDNFLEVTQISPTEYIPNLPKSYTKFKVEELVAGKKVMVEHAIMEIESDLGKRKTWKTYMERTAKDRFTIVGFLDKHWRAIELSIIIFVMFVGFAIVYSKIPTVG